MTETVNFPLLKKAKLVIFGLVGGAVLMGILVIGMFMPRNQYYSSSMPSYRGGVGMDSTANGLTLAPSLDYDFSGAKQETVVGNSVDRRVTRNYVSAHVKNTQDYSNKISVQAELAGGKVMNVNLSETVDGTNSFGTLMVLVPNAQVETFLDKVTSESIKIVDTQLLSYEISQEYTDLERRLAQAEETYSRLKVIYEKATTVEEILKVQRELTNMQSEIDSIKGRKRALDELSTNTQITIYFSTDEFALPYVPEGTFEFGKTFKTAVRALVSTVDAVLALGIWLVVFSPLLLVPAVIGWYFLARGKRTKK